MKRLRRWVLRWAVRPGRPGAMTEREIAMALSVEEKHPVLRAVLVLLEAHIEDAVTTTRAAATSKDHGLLAHEAGGLDALLSLRETIAAVREGGADGEKWG
jgi:hypothetical protein